VTHSILTSSAVYKRVLDASLGTVGISELEVHHFEVVGFKYNSLEVLYMGE
jgi:hypothetical protein